MLCHLSNPQQSTSPWEKKVKHPKMIESWKVEYDTCMPCYCPRHVSQVKCLVTATGLLSLFASVIHWSELWTLEFSSQTHCYQFFSPWFFILFWVFLYVNSDRNTSVLWSMSCLAPLPSPPFRVSVRVYDSKGGIIPGPMACALRCNLVTCHLTNP